MSVANVATALASIALLNFSAEQCAEAFVGRIPTPAAFHVSTSSDGRRAAVAVIPGWTWNRRTEEAKTVQGLIPISDLCDEVSFLSSPESRRACVDERGRLLRGENDDGKDDDTYFLAIAEEVDLPEVARLTIDAFDATAITLSSDLSNFERALVEPPVALFNAYTGAFAYAEVLSGVRSRMKDRLQSPGVSPPPVVDNCTDDSEAAAIAAKSSLILTLARPRPNGESDAIAAVELRLQPTDAKIPFSQPWIDAIERSAAKWAGLDLPTRDAQLQPYISNLCVDQRFRGRRIGRSLVRLCEDITTQVWGYSKIYLHVDLDNGAAFNLYKSEGYQDVGFRWNPFWAGAAAEIGYFVKSMDD